jgi:adenylate kinase family enzyme
LSPALQPRRLVLLGCAGAGKTTLARNLAAAMGAPAIILDEIWPLGGAPADAPAFRETLAALHAGPAWVSDGNFAAVSFDIRLPRADLILWLERPRWLCLLRATVRALRGGQGHRLRDLPKVIAFIWNFDRINRPRIEECRAIHGPNVPVIHLRSAEDAAAIEQTLRV